MTSPSSPNPGDSTGCEITGLDAQDQALIAAARKARGHSHSPYSGFAVGAALRTTDGRVFAGCNVENASFGLTICAERSAVVSAVSAGALRFEAVAVIAPGESPSAWPCGACRQVLAEFGMDLTVWIAGERGARASKRLLRELLPENFVFPRSSTASPGPSGSQNPLGEQNPAGEK